MEKHRIKSLSLPVLAISMAIIMPLIAGNCGDAYRKATVTRDNICFEFEYPSSFRDPYNTLGNSTIVVESVVLLRPHLNPDEGDDTTFKINLFNKKNTPDISTFIENFLQSWAKLPEAQQFSLLDRSETEVGGIPGEKIVYSIIFLLAGEVLDSHVSYVREVYFEYKGIFWNIKWITLPEMVEQTEEEFDHIIQTFKFLN